MKTAVHAVAFVLLFSPSLFAGDPSVRVDGRLGRMVAVACERSQTLRSVMERVEALDGARLRVVQGAQPSSFVRARSELRVRREGATRIEGTVYLPPAASTETLAALLAHELAHVLQRAGELIPGADDPKGEGQAVAFEHSVRSELEGAFAANATNANRCLAPPTLTAAREGSHSIRTGRRR